MLNSAEPMQLTTNAFSRIFKISIDSGLGASRSRGRQSAACLKLCMEKAYTFVTTGHFRCTQGELPYPKSARLRPFLRVEVGS